MSGKYKIKLNDFNPIWNKEKVRKECKPSLDIAQPYTWSQSLSEELQFDIQSTPYQGKMHFELQLMPTYPYSHAGNEIKRENV